MLEGGTLKEKYISRSSCLTSKGACLGRRLSRKGTIISFIIYIIIILRFSPHDKSKLDY